METTRTEPRGATDSWLLGAATLFAVAVMLHNADHVRRGADAVARDVFWVGTASILVEVGVVVLICRRHRTAPLAAAAVGLSLAAGYILVHFMPARSWLSDSLTDATDVSGLTWSAASLEVIAALALGATGVAALRQRGGLGSATSPHPGERPLRDGMTHPLVVVFAASQVVVLVASFAQLGG